jgi:hypothetical protein
VWPGASCLSQLLADGQLPDHLVPIGSDDMNWTMNTRGAIHHVTRFQIPLSGAEATIFHKAQGATFDKKETGAEVQMGLKPKHKMVGCDYVALSRTVDTGEFEHHPNQKQCR